MLAAGESLYACIGVSNTGIVFRRVDLDPVVEFPASAGVVGDTRMASVLIKDAAALERAGGVKTEAARLLSLTFRSLRYRLMQRRMS